MRAYLPVLWLNYLDDRGTDGLGGPPVEDGGIIYIYRDEYYDEYMDNYNIFEPDKTPLIAIKTSFNDLVDDVIESMSINEDGKLDDSAFIVLNKIRKALMDAVAKIDTALL